MTSVQQASVPLINKKRKLQRACDYCRLKKLKCDGGDTPDNRCSRCVARQDECTYQDSFNRNGYPSSYVENLERRLERMEQFVNKLCPDVNVSQEVEGSLYAAEPSKSTESHSFNTFHPGSLRPEPSSKGILSPSFLSSSLQSPSGTEPREPTDPDEDTDDDLTEGLRKLSLESHPYRFHGSSSGMLLLRGAKQTGRDDNSWGQQQEHYRHLGPGSPREMPIFNDFPDDDLLSTLVELYFRRCNDLIPLLHEPLFKQNLKDGLHLRIGGFGATVLLVCANASRFSQDRRVLLDGSDGRHSAGWKWYRQVERMQKLELCPATLYELQTCVLMAEFLGGSTAAQASWVLLGNGIRRAIDVGAHRKKVYNAKPTIEDELWKRAFWVLVLQEWTCSYGLGRPASVHDADVDVSLPTLIDDQYWNLPGAGNDNIPQQPEGEPSKVAAMVSLISLSQILAFATKTLYPVNKSKRNDPSWEQHIVAELDSALNNWVNSLPSHLRWDANREDPLHLMQSGYLLGHYFHVQIAVHRPFLSASHRDSPLSFPSIIICNNAARSTIQMTDVVFKRLGTLYHGSAGLLFMSGAVLMHSIWGQRRSGRTVNVDRDIACINTAIEMLDSMRHETHIAASGWDYLTGLLAEANAWPSSQDTTVSQAEGERIGVHQISTQRVPPFQNSHTLHTEVDSPETSETGQTSVTIPSLASATLEQLRQELATRTMPHEQVAGPLTSSGTGQPITDTAGLSEACRTGSTIEQSFMPPVTPPPTFVRHPTQSMLSRHHQHFAGVSSGSLQNVDVSQANLGVGAMFGLEPLWYSEAVPWIPPSTFAVASDIGIQSSFSPEGVGSGHQAPDSTTDFTVLHETLSAWTNGPRWDEWGAYFNNTNGGSSNPGA